MKNIKKIVALLFAVLFCLSAAVMTTSAAEVNQVDGAILEFAPLQGDVNIDGYLNLRDLVRYKKYNVQYEGAVIDEEVADMNGDEIFNADDLVKLQDDIIVRIFG